MNIVKFKSKVFTNCQRIDGIYPILNKCGKLNYFGLSICEYNLIQENGIVKLNGGQIELNLDNEIDMLKYIFISNHSMCRIHNNIRLI